MGGALGVGGGVPGTGDDEKNWGGMSPKISIWLVKLSDAAGKPKRKSGGIPGEIGLPSGETDEKFIPDKQRHRCLE